VLISGGWRHTAAADDAGRLFTWGWNKVTPGALSNVSSFLPKRSDLCSVACCIAPGSPCTELLNLAVSCTLHGS
jgi:hypothetical protein